MPQLALATAGRPRLMPSASAIARVSFFVMGVLPPMFRFFAFRHSEEDGSIINAMESSTVANPIILSTKPKAKQEHILID
jgi:hypothetical protein